MGPGTNPSTFSHTKALCLQTPPSLRACASGTLYGFFFNLWGSNLSFACDIRKAKLNSPDEFLLCVQEVTGDKVLALEKSRELSGGSGHNCVSEHRPNERQPWDTAIQFICTKGVLRENALLEFFT